MELVLRVALVAALAGLGVVTMTQRGRALDREQAASAQTALTELGARENRLLDDARALVGAQLHNDDPLVDDVRALSATLARLEPLRHGAWLDADARASLSARLDEARAALRAQESDVEGLKMYWARLRNSQDNFPAYADALAAQTAAAIKTDVQQLQLRVAQFQAGRANDGDAIEALARRLEDAARGPREEDLKWVAGHARVIVDSRAAVERFKTALNAAPARQRVMQLQVTWDRALGDAVKRGTERRAVLYSLGGVVAALALACIVLRVRRGGRA